MYPAPMFEIEHFGTMMSEDKTKEHAASTNSSASTSTAPNREEKTLNPDLTCSKTMVAPEGWTSLMGTDLMMKVSFRCRPTLLPCISHVAHTSRVSDAKNKSFVFGDTSGFSGCCLCRHYWLLGLVI